MSSEISSDVQYVIDQIDKMKNNRNEIDILYDRVTVDGKTRLIKETTQQQPELMIRKPPNDKTYRTLIMIDPDAPSSNQPITGPFVHWILANCEEHDGANGKSICPYMGPGPRPGTGTHRYLFLFYESMDRVATESIFDDIPQRRKFPLSKFVVDNHLNLVDVTFFTVDA